MRKIVKQCLGIEARTGKPSPLRRESLYLCLSVVALILSAWFPAIEEQFLVFAIIAGARWIVVGRTDRINIVIRQGGEYGS